MKLEISRKKIDQDFELLGLNHMIVIVQISTMYWDFGSRNDKREKEQVKHLPIKKKSIVLMTIFLSNSDKTFSLFV